MANILIKIIRIVGKLTKDWKKKKKKKENLNSLFDVKLTTDLFWFCLYKDDIS